MTEIDWRRLGFRSRPEHRVAVGTEIVFRVGGGPSNHLLGRFFSLVKPDSVLKAELRFNISLYGNRCFYVATYQMKRGIPYLVGEVGFEPGDQQIRSAQVFIERPIEAKVDLLDVQPLIQDRFVSPRPGLA